ncbi:uncharacterized protein [Triticum aestivum]|uniref:uncharacterized protein n=1 Tax=Triticum aestivum TaxID=4565 RepID=UPI001D023BF6|nr:uncharacterized protein LOC123147878 [Triticum aestivum]
MDKSWMDKARNTQAYIDGGKLKGDVSHSHTQPFGSGEVHGKSSNATTSKLRSRQCCVDYVWIATHLHPRPKQCRLTSTSSPKRYRLWSPLHRQWSMVAQWQKLLCMQLEVDKCQALPTGCLLVQF